ncbi:MAG TPA: VOC family protein [Terriglobales bacterium]|nr:VOC family protein [Terriglobales bacterium]
MDKPSLAEQLDRALQAVLTGQGGELVADDRLAPLLRMVHRLRDLPRPEFKASLKSELQGKTPRARAVPTLAAGSPAVTPYLSVENAPAAIEFYTRAFGAQETMRFEDQGKIGSAELVIGTSTIRLSDEFPEFGSLSPKALGGSPVKLQLYVEDVDGFAERAVAQGAKIARPVEDQFYGDRSGQLADPFGHVWIIATRKEVVSREEMHRRWNAILGEEQAKVPKVSPVRKGFRSLTPYLVARDGPALLEFTKKVFEAEETFRGTGSAGGLHGEVRIGDSMLMIGGGLPGKEFRATPTTIALHVYVKDTDTVYQRALASGASTIHGPADMEYGERSAAVKDQAGNYWYIATHQGPSYVPQDLNNVNVYLHPLRADPVIKFLERAFAAQAGARYASPDGVVHHAAVHIGTSVLEMGEANGPYQPMSSMLYLYLPDTDAAYRNALAAGATSLQQPADQPWGDRLATVKDAFGNLWNIASHRGIKQA